jgi:hypothetical protein
LTLWGSQGFLYDLNGSMTADGNNAAPAPPGKSAQ